MLSVGNANIFPAHFGGLSAVLAAGMPVVTGAGGQLAVGHMPGSVAAGLMPGNEMNSPSPDMFTTVRYTFDPKKNGMKQLRFCVFS